jgi:hypothetical protein
MRVFIASLCAFGSAAARSQTRGSFGLPPMMSAAFYVRGGSEETGFGAALEQAKAVSLQSAMTSIQNLSKKIIDEASIVEDFGAQAESVSNQALQEFASRAPEPGDDPSKASMYDKKLSELEQQIDSPLHVLYLKQLAYLREQALQRYRTATKTTTASDYEAMLQADNSFVTAASKLIKSSSNWDYTYERSFLQAVLNSSAESARKAETAALTASKQQSTAMQFLQNQQQMIQQLQQQLYGQSSPWNVGVAYRIPDTNLNLQGTYQQGRANIQLSCVPDEYAPFLGPNGFTNGVGPGNLGLSLNLSI